MWILKKGKRQIKPLTLKIMRYHSLVDHIQKELLRRRMDNIGALKKIDTGGIIMYATRLHLLITVTPSTAPWRPNFYG